MNYSPSIIRGRVQAMSPQGLELQTAGGVQRVAGDSRALCEVGDLVAVTDRYDGRPEVTVLAHPAQDPTGPDALRWLSTAAGVSRAELLRRRSRVASAIRRYFEDQEFIELHAPLLVRGTCPDAGIDSVAVGDSYLTTSTEYQIKRLVVGGLERVYTLTQNFRAGEFTALHNPEFTMLEWARAGASLAAIEQDVTALVQAAAAALGLLLDRLVYQGCQIDLRTPWERVTVREAWQTYLGVEVDAAFSLASLQRAVAHLGLSVPAASHGDPADLATLLLDAVQPHLGQTRPSFLVDWPAVFTSSALVKDQAGHTVERSELFIAGVEVADGFPSLTDPTRQLETFAAQQDRRRALGKEPVALDTAYLGALEDGLPAGAGMALGFDRLVMLLTNQTEIRSVLAFAWDER